MAKFAPLSRSKHAEKTWSPPAHFGFASHATYVEAAGAEVGQLGADMPLAFVRHGDRLVLVGLLSCIVGRNLFVGADGRWMGSYIPATFKFHPFRLMQTADSVVLCVDETSPLFADSGGQRLFDDSGELSKLAGEIVQGMELLRKTQAPVTMAARGLEEAGVIVPWQLEVKGEKSGTIFEQIHRVDEKLLQKLDDSSFLKLRKSGALALAYTQIVSMGRVAYLRQLAVHHQSIAATTSGAVTLSDVLGFGNNDVLNFDR